MAKESPGLDQPIDVARKAIETLGQLEKECCAAGLDAVAHFVGVAILEAEETVQEMDAAQKTATIIEQETRDWSHTKLPAHDLRAIFNHS